MKILQLSTGILAAIRSVWSRGSPFAALTALWPTNGEGKYIIEAEGIRLAFSNHGAALSNLWLNNTYGEEIDVVMGMDNAQNYLKLDTNPYLNGVIGRYAGYLSGAKYDLDGTSYELAGNAHNGTSLFNGGKDGWGRQTWDIAVHTSNSITFVLFDNRWNGFPGIFASCVTHTVTPYQWRIAFGVTPLLKAGPINLSQQVFFNLDGFKGKKNDILGHKLHLPTAGMRFDIDDIGIPTGDLRSNPQGELYDFWSAPKLVGEEVRKQSSDVTSANSGEFSALYMLSHKQHGDKEDAPAAILSSKRSGITLELYTDQDALNVHTWNDRDVSVALKDDQGTGNVPQHGAISMEMQDWPDAVNHPEWINRKTLWGMDGLFTRFATYKFSVADQE